MSAHQKCVPTRVGLHFQSTEFDCQCRRPECQTTQIDSDLVRRLEALRASVQLPVVIVSGYRCKPHQESLRAAGMKAAALSQHCLGRAVDCRVDGLTSAVLAEHAALVGFKAIGLARTFVHLDLRFDRVRKWHYLP